jgi:uracil phosphoribosyltransferase
MAANVHVSGHPLVQHKLSELRATSTGPAQFRRLVDELALLLTYELTQDFALTRVRVRTPVAELDAPSLAGPPAVLVPVLRAGLGLVQGVLTLLPDAAVAHIGLVRDPVSLQPTQYYFNGPRSLGGRDAIVLDPMLATGNSAAAAVARVRLVGPRSIRLLCLLAAPEGLARLHADHPDVQVFTAAVDGGLDGRGYIVPGLGDAGDRLFDTDPHG